MNGITLLAGDCRETLKTLAENSVHCVVTSPPYFGLRDYGCDGQIGLEQTPLEFVQELVSVFREVRRVLRQDGVCWVNMGDSFAKSGDTFPGIKPKDMIGIPHQLAFALRDDGWFLRQDICWAKGSPMPESVTDRLTKSHEYIFLLAKSEKYFFDQQAIKEPVSGTSHPRGNGVNPKSKANQFGSKQNESFSAAVSGLVEDRNKRSVWTVDDHQQLAGWLMERSPELYRQFVNEATNKSSVWKVNSVSYSGAHFATFPPDLIRPCILSGTSEHGCCPRCGAPWERIVEKDRVATRPGNNTKVGRVSDDHGPDGKSGKGMIVGNRDPQRHCTTTITTGWRPGCGCGAELQPVPCTVLDPFNGSGTTGEVARQEGCHYVGCELNPEYLELTRKRLQQGSLLV